MNTISDCIFCGASTETRLDQGAIIPAIGLHSFDRSFCVQCENCGASGPIEVTGEGAIKKWNTAMGRLREVESLKNSVKLLTSALMTTRGNILSIKNYAGGVVTYDEWLRVVDESLHESARANMRQLSQLSESERLAVGESVALKLRALNEIIG